jgi:predicted nucleic acid-binding protein
LLIPPDGWNIFTTGKNAGYFARVIGKTGSLVVSAINLFEVYRKVLAERNRSTARLVAALMNQADVIDVDSTIAPLAAELRERKKIPAKDSIICITAKMHNAILWSRMLI